MSFDTYILAHQMYKNFFAYFTPQTPRTCARLYKGRQKRHSDCMVDIFHKKCPQKAQLCGFMALCNLPGKGYIGGLDKKDYGDSTLFFPTVIHSHSRLIPRPISSPFPTSPTPTFHHYIRNNSPSTLPSLTPIQSSDYHFEQTAYLRRFPHSRSTSILCYFITVMSLYCRKTPYFRSIPSKNIELSFNFKQFHHTHAETSAF